MHSFPNKQLEKKQGDYKSTVHLVYLLSLYVSLKTDEEEDDDDGVDYIPTFAYYDFSSILFPKCQLASFHHLFSQSQNEEKQGCMAEASCMARSRQDLRLNPP